MRQNLRAADEAIEGCYDERGLAVPRRRILLRTAREQQFDALMVALAGGHHERRAAESWVRRIDIHVRGAQPLEDVQLPGERRVAHRWACTRRAPSVSRADATADESLGFLCSQP